MIFNPSLIGLTVTLTVAVATSIAIATFPEVLKEQSLTHNLYGPRFLCPEKIQTKLHEQNVNLTCRVHANPGVEQKDIKFTWISSDGDDNHTMLAGDKNNEVSTSMRNEDNNNEVIMVLTIHRVLEKHFNRKYIFEAENDVKHVTHTIELEEVGLTPKATFVIVPEIAKEHDSMTAVCNVKKEEATSFFILWIKKTIEDNQLVEIATNSHINAQFTNTSRYQASYVLKTQDYKEVEFTLHIKDLRPEDSGYISCRFGAPEGIESDFKKFTVQVPVQKVWWTLSNERTVIDDGQVISYKEGDIQQVTCHVNGSYPEPEIVQVFIGHQDITHLFNVTHYLKKGEGPKGLRPLYYRTDLVSHNLNIGYNNMSKRIKCVTKLSTSDSLKAASIIVNLTEYSPKFFCAEKMHAKLHDQFFNISCRVHAYPGVKDSKIVWHSDDDNNSVVVDKNSNDISSSMSEGDSKDEVIMVMTIHRVSKRHFQRHYIFEAVNDVKRVTHMIELEEVTASEFNLSANTGRMGRSSVLWISTTAMLSALASILILNTSILS